MGYTNKWQQNEAFTDAQWEELTNYVRNKAPKPKGVRWEVDNDCPCPHIYVQGDSWWNEDHEGFYLFKAPSERYHSCKTARKPYDKTVWAILCKASSIGSNFWIAHD